MERREDRSVEETNFPGLCPERDKKRTVWQMETGGLGLGRGDRVDAEHLQKRDQAIAADESCEGAHERLDARFGVLGPLTVGIAVLLDLAQLLLQSGDLLA